MVILAAKIQGSVLVNKIGWDSTVIHKVILNHILPGLWKDVVTRRWVYKTFPDFLLHNLVKSSTTGWAL